MPVLSNWIHKLNIILVKNPRNKLFLKFTKPLVNLKLLKIYIKWVEKTFGVLFFHISCDEIVLINVLVISYIISHHNFIQLPSWFQFLQSRGLQHARLLCASPAPRVCPSSCYLNRWYHLTISSSVDLFFFYLQSFATSRSFPMSWLFASGDQSIGALASASVLPMSIQDLFPLGVTDLISVQSKGLSRVFSSITVWK